MLRLPGPILAIPLLLAIACGEEAVNPFDTAAIESDMKERPVRELYAAAAKVSWTPPEDGLLTDAHIQEFMEVAALGKRISEVAGERLDDQIESASRDDDRFARMGTAFSALGTVRNAATAHLRAALTLGKNPHQHNWVAEQLLQASQVAVQKRAFDVNIERAQEAVDTETIEYLRVEKESALSAQRATRDSWLQNHGDITLANSEMVAAHADELALHIPVLKRMDPVNP